MSDSSFSVAEEGIEISFFRVPPGKERAAAVKMGAIKPPALTYKVFGRWDFVSLRSFKDESVIAPIAQNVEALELYDVLCFRWSDSGDPRPLEESSKPLLGISFIKINPECQHRLGIGAEQYLAEQVSQKLKMCKDSIDTITLGTLGWAEAILLVRGNEFGDILRFIWDIRQIAAPPKSPGKLILSTLTIPGISCMGGTVPPDLPFGRIGVNLLASCKPGSCGRVISQFSQSLGNCYLGAGPYDILVDVSNATTLSDYVDRLWDTREKLANDLYWTSTRLFIKDAEVVKCEAEPTQKQFGEEIQGEVPAKVVTIPDLQYIKSQFPDSYQRLSGAVSQYNAYTSDERVAACFSDLDEYVRQMITAIDNAKEDIREVVLGNLVDILVFAMQQRYEATYTTILSVRNFTPGCKGGAHRSIVATGYLCKCLLEQAVQIPGKIKWTGFTVFGYTTDYHRYDGGVISLPSSLLYHPEKWWGMFHECGHEFGAQMEILDQPDVREILRTKLGFRNLEEEEFVWEVFSEIFAYLFGFGRQNWKLCIKSTWQYLEHQPKFEQRMINYLSRFLLIYLYELLSGKENPFDSKEHLHAKCEGIRREIEHFCKPLEKLDEASFTEIVDAVYQFDPLLRVFHTILDPIQKSSEKVARVDYKRIQTGQIVTKPDPPNVYLLHLMQDSTLSFRARVTFILSLWHASCLEKLPH